MTVGLSSPMQRAFRWVRCSISACAIQFLYFNVNKRHEHALIAGLISGCG